MERLIFQLVSRRTLWLWSRRTRKRRILDLHGEKLLTLVQAYIEAKHLPNYYNAFLAEIIPFYKEGKMLSGTVDMDSELMLVYRRYLEAFDDFSIIDARKEFEILENILDSTATLLKDFGIQPKSEPEVYKPMIKICKTAFPDNKDCSHYKFQKTAKCYHPDILIPSLECAIEFKYVNDEKSSTGLWTRFWQMSKAIKGILRILFSTPSFMRQIPFVHPKDSTACGQKSIFRKLERDLCPGSSINSLLIRAPRLEYNHILYEQYLPSYSLFTYLSWMLFVFN